MYGDMKRRIYNLIVWLKGSKLCNSANDSQFVIARLSWLKAQVTPKAMQPGVPAGLSCRIIVYKIINSYFHSFASSFSVSLSFLALFFHLSYLCYFIKCINRCYTNVCASVTCLFAPTKGT